MYVIEDTPGLVVTRTLPHILDHLDDWYRDGRYRASPLLRHAASVERLHGPRTTEDQ